MTKYMLLRSVSTVLVALLSSAAHAEVVISQYEQLKGNELFRYYIQGVNNGFGWANTELEVAGRPRLYCVPTGKHSTAEDTLQMVDRYVAIVRKSPAFLSQSAENQANYPMPSLLLHALKTEFPCGEERRAEKRVTDSLAPMQQAATVIQLVPAYQPPPLPAMPATSFPSAPGRTTTVCRTLSNGTVVCD